MDELDIDDVITSEDPDERLEAWEDETWTPTPEQVLIGLNDEEDGVRYAVWCRTDWSPTEAQIEQGLEDDFQVREAIWQRDDWTPSPAIIEDSLSGDEDVRDSIWCRTDWSPSMDQVEKYGLADEFAAVRLAVWKRNDWQPSHKHFDFAARDSDERVRAAAAEREHQTLKSKQSEITPPNPEISAL